MFNTNPNNNVRFTLQDEDDNDSINQQDPAELRKLKELSVKETSLGANNNGRASAPISRTSSSIAPSSLTASRRPSKNDVYSHPHSRIHTPDISPPSTPRGDPDDPYRRSARLPQSTSLADIAPQFIFQKHLPTSSHQSSHIHLKDFFHSHHSKEPNSTREKIEHRSHSGFDLGRFFRHGNAKKSSSTASPPLSTASSVYMPEFDSKVPKKVKGDDHMGFHQKYGKAGKVLGSGAGGSVRIVKRLSDNHLFAVKEFRERGPTESQKEYNKKVTAEFCVASAMHHSNVIETMEVLKENQKWYQVMAYAPYDLFAIVMTGKMEKQEVFCSFKQLLRGVEYLHGMGLAHRDLKLDNLVVDENGIVKIIDFGSAIVFKYPFEEEIHEATGIVGSDPYLSPETCTSPKYSPAPADIWSCAIIYCCMWLKRFPWKSPRMSDNSFKQFAAPDNSAELSNQQHLETAPTQGQQQQPPPGEPQVQIRGPWRLLRLLPRESRSVIKGMLELLPENRHTMHDIVGDSWIQSIDMCYEDKNTGTVHKSATHQHVLIGPEAQKPKSGR
ncbi:Serine/threonine-protein kinase oca2 [Taphrina deformans PYCC 5710]|uniref:non-specific serine/threonine protein kinase n=1 Tax=Taphrina deformans (strain PYCC 5710 / ATCC 11124 / CBS 356.35 / IMI 108563 / JCM 9778 / NBRC 8474) TaxID=1097556 RepID=R4XAD0_TAPDE|nr:Serine/threonine-protein kinase oca2 [Taphrina deformans PYCC 5710]|eukprot:CCG81229.1 Serine/threonine-protein kinase oca2 [Taphrina deformans PYCC 5710]